MPPIHRHTNVCIKSIKSLCTHTFYEFLSKNPLGYQKTPIGVFLAVSKSPLGQPKPKAWVFHKPFGLFAPGALERKPPKVFLAVPKPLWGFGTAFGLPKPLAWVDPFGVLERNKPFGVFSRTTLFISAKLVLDQSVKFIN